MTKDYMLKRVEKYCSKIDAHVELFPSGVVNISYHNNSLLSDCFYRSLTDCYKDLFGK